MDFKDYKPMLACPVDLDKVGKYPNYTMEVKLDGIRCIAMKDEHQTVTMWTRAGNELHHKLESLRVQLRAIPGVWVLDGEIGYLLYDKDWRVRDNAGDLPYGVDFNATVRVTGSDDYTAKNKQQNNIANGMQPIKYSVFDILHRGNYPLYRDAQYARRSELISVFNKAGDDLHDVVMNPYFNSWDAEVYADVIGRGGEGIMLKNPDAAYQPGKRRANTWYKVKGFDTIDCMITGYDPGQGKYEGALGALVVQDPTGQDIRISGMTDTARHAMTEHFRDYIGKMCEVKYFGKVGANKDGYRHPQFLRMRPDLDSNPK